MANETSGKTARAGGPLRYFWQTGCSSCQRTKEFLLKNKVEFESINLAETPERMPELTARGLRTVPVLMDDERHIIAQDLRDVAAFVGLEMRHKPLPPTVLSAKMEAILESALVSTGAVPTERLGESLPGRERPHRELIHHIFRVAEGFLEDADDDRPQGGSLNVMPGADVTTPDLLSYGADVRARFRAWAARPEAADGGRELTTASGRNTLDFTLERATWHSAHHTRQLERLALPAVGAAPAMPLSAATLEGLPMPETIY